MSNAQGNGPLAIDGGSPIRSTPLPSSSGAALIGDEERQAVLEVIESRSLFRYYGEEKPWRVATLEKEFSAAIGVRHGLAVTSGTAALRVAFIACGLAADDEILIPAYAFLACTTSAITCGLRPRFVECDDSLLLDPNCIEDAVTDRTRAILAVHMNGAATSMDPILEIARRRNLVVIEDCAQAVGTSDHGRPVGSLGSAGTFSLQYLKTITAGEGGVVVTDDPGIQRRGVGYHDLGIARRGRDQEAIAGENLRMSELTGAVALAQFRRLPEFVAAMRQVRARLDPVVDSIPGLDRRVVPDPEGDNGNSLVIHLADADLAKRFRKALTAENIRCDACHDKLAYTYPCLQGRHPLFRDRDALDEPASCPRTEALVARSVMVPIGPAFTDDDARDIEAGIRKVASHIL